MKHAEDSCIIRDAQERYLKQGGSEDLEAIYWAARRIAARMIARQVQTKGFILPEELKEEKAHNAAAYIIEQFIKRPGFFLKKPAAYVYLRVLHELYYRRKVDTIVMFKDSQDIARILSGKEEKEEEE